MCVQVTPPRRGCAEGRELRWLGRLPCSACFAVCCDCVCPVALALLLAVLLSFGARGGEEGGGAGGERGQGNLRGPRNGDGIFIPNPP